MKPSSALLVVGLLVAGVGAAVVVGSRARPPLSDDKMRTIQIGTVTRRFLIHVPASARDVSGLPAVIVLHGGKGGPDSVAKLTGFNPLADQHRFIVAYPKAFASTWNDGRASTAATSSDADDRRFLTALLDMLENEYRIDAARVYLVGMSNGAMAAHRFGCEMSERFAAIATVSGGMAAAIAPGCNPSRPMSVVGIYGTADPIVSWDGGEVKRGAPGLVLGARATTEVWARAARCQPRPIHEELPPSTDDGTRVWREVYRPCGSEARVVLYGIEGGGHAWPPNQLSRLGRVARLLLGKSSKNLDATTVIWQFFSDASIARDLPRREVLADSPP